MTLRRSLQVSAAALAIISGLVFVEFRKRGGVMLIDYSGLGAIEFPTQTEWNTVLEEHEAEIRDGSRNKFDLDNSYLGGWKQCFDRFSNGHLEWNYYELKENEPWQLGGSMLDTDRVAGNKGWKSASDLILVKLQQLSVDEVQSRLRRINPKLWLILGLWGATLTLLITAQLGTKESKQGHCS
jgi:hypothetical protein